MAKDKKITHSEKCGICTVISLEKKKYFYLQWTIPKSTVIWKSQKKVKCLHFIGIYFSHLVYLHFFTEATDILSSVTDCRTISDLFQSILFECCYHRFTYRLHILVLPVLSSRLFQTYPLCLSLHHLLLLMHFLFLAFYFFLVLLFPLTHFPFVISNELCLHLIPFCLQIFSFPLVLYLLIFISVVILLLPLLLFVSILIFLPIIIFLLVLLFFRSNTYFFFRLLFYLFIFFSSFPLFSTTNISAVSPISCCALNFLPFVAGLKKPNGYASSRVSVYISKQKSNNPDR